MTVEKRARWRRDLSRNQTADFLALSDMLAVFIVFITILIKAGSWSALLKFPWLVVMIGLAILLVRSVVVFLLTGTIKRFGFGIAGVAVQMISAVRDDEGKTLVPVRAIPRSAEMSKRTLVGLLTFGFVAIILIVSGSGGVAESPFRDILVATFILGQFRAPTIKAIWTLFAAGLLVATTAHVLYIVFKRINGSAFEGLEYLGTYHIAPGVLVALLATIVTTVTFLDDRSSSQAQIRRHSQDPELP